MPYPDLHAAAFGEGGEVDPDALLAEHIADMSAADAKIATMTDDHAAAIADAAAQLAAKDAELLVTKAANYDLITQVGVTDVPADETSDSDDPDENASFTDDFFSADDDEDKD
jgi:hypothetical protein